MKPVSPSVAAPPASQPLAANDTPHAEPPAAPDFGLLQQSAVRHGARSRLALAAMLGLIALGVLAVLSLVYYLKQFEQDEANRQRAADALWLEQSVQFHFRRLEDDLLTLAHQASSQPSARPHTLWPPQAAMDRGGLLWREPGVLRSVAWMPAQVAGDAPAAPERWLLDRQAHPANARAQDLMREVTRGLRRSAYAGPMLDARGREGDVLWMAVPYFERGVYVGAMLAAVALDPALSALIPAWFAQNHSVQRVGADGLGAQRPRGPRDALGDRVALNLPGTDVFVEVAPTALEPASVPRVFLLVALVFGAGMLIALWALRRDMRKRAQVQALLQAQIALRTAMENSVNTGLRAWDLQGRILYVNPAFARLVGYTSQELVGLAMPFPYWPAAQRVQLARVHAEILAGGTGGAGVEVQFQHRDGHLIDVLIHEAPLSDAQGQQVGWMSSVLDVSERKRAQRLAAQQQQRLEASARLVSVGEVASTLAHELNQPLGALASFATGLLNRLRAGPLAAGELQPVVERMARLAERAGQILHRVGDFARRRELQRVRLDLAAAVGAMLQRRTPAACPLHIDLPNQPVWVLADALLLEHLLGNLLANAQDWAARRSEAVHPPRVRVQVRQEADRAVLRVGDTGPGVPEAERDAVFNAFVSHKEGGMGMGLAICRSIAEAHHARLSVATDPLLGGALFEVIWPLAPVPSA